MEFVKRLLEQRAAVEAEKKAKLDELSAAAEGEKRSLNDEELKAIDAFNSKLVEIDERVKELTDQEIRSKEVADAASKVFASSSVVVRSEAKPYDRGSGQSYFRDLALSQRFNDGEANSRLREYREKAPKIAEDMLRNRDSIALQHAEEIRAINTTDGGIGEFVAPLWLLSQYAEKARFGRVTANLIGSEGLPQTDQVSIPTITTGTVVAAQTTQGDTVTSQDLVSSSVSGTVKTLAGSATASLQLLEQSSMAGGIDQIILQDLMADYALQLDAALLVTINDTASINLRTFTGTTVLSLYSSLMGASVDIETNRKAPAEVIVMHPRRWGWLAAQGDVNGRPVITPASVAQNTFTTLNGPVAEGFRGEIAGLPIYSDGNILTTYGTTSDEDRVFVFRPTDMRLYESTPRTSVDFSLLNNKLQAYFRLYNYYAFIPNRFAKSITRIAGSGFNASATL